MFAQLEPSVDEKEFQLEVKSIDNGLKLSKFFGQGLESMGIFDGVAIAE